MRKFQINKKFVVAILAMFLFISGYAQTISVIEQLKLELDTTQNDKYRVTIYSKMASEIMGSNPTQAKEYAQLGVNYAVGSNYSEGLGMAQKQLGIANFYLGNYNEAFNVFEKALQTFIDLELPNEQSGIYKRMGLTKAFQDEYLEGIAYYKKSLAIDIENTDTAGIATCYNDIGVLYNYQGDHDLSIEYQKKSLVLCEQLNDKKGMGSRLLNLGVSYEDVSLYSEAIACYNQALVIKSELEDNKGISNCLTNLGEVFKELGDYAKAIEYYEQSLHIDKSLDDETAVAISLFNIGTIHHKQQNESKAIDYYNESLQYGVTLDNKRLMAHAQNGLGEAFAALKNFDEAIAYLESARQNALLANDKSEMAKSVYLLGLVYFNMRDFQEAIIQFEQAAIQHDELHEQANYTQDLIKIGEAFFNLQDYNKAIEYNFKGLISAKKIESKDNIRQAAENLSKVFARQKNFEDAYKYALLFKETHDSIFTLESQKQLSLIENRFELERKEKEIELQNARLEKQAIEIKQNKVMLFALVGGTLGLLLIVVLVVINYNRTRKAKNLIQEQKNQIEEKNEELNQANEELKVTLDLNTQQKELIEQNNREITGSIQYATHIQNAVLPTKEKLHELFADHFVIFKPKNIVSGDFYWATHKNDRTIFAAADCTGHGVPGAFMSMLGVSFLKDIVNKENITAPNVILDKLRNAVIQALNQTGKIAEHRDGMDIGICAIDMKSKILQYAGAHHPLYIIRSNKKPVIQSTDLVQGETYSLYSFKADRMPIAINVHMHNFSADEFQLEKGDRLYMFSDGYADQFGGKFGKRFTTAQLKHLLLKYAHLPLIEQRRAIEIKFNSWKSGWEQIDDVMILGVEI